MSDPDGQAPALRQVEQVVRHREPLGFRALCEQLLPPETRYLVLDLDRTVHLGVNTGEMLGWELNAWHCYGEAALGRMEPVRGRERMLFDREQPAASVRYFLRGLRQWAVPGFYYLVWGKLALQLPWLYRLAVKRHGPHALQHAQRATQLTLMRILQAADPALVAVLAEKVWQRHRGRQAITRADLAWVRARCPDVQIILTSASPEPTVATAARHLGIDTFVYSTLDCINSGEQKVRRLRQLRPDIADRDVVTVGISDTQYGEDHCWAGYFHSVADINGEWPFPEQVAADARLRAVHSAQVLTQDELSRRADGQPDYCDPLRDRLSEHPPHAVPADPQAPDYARG